MKLIALVTSLSLAATVSGCGKKNAKDLTDNLPFLNDPTGDITTDAASLAENQSDTLDEVATALNENGSAGSALGLTESLFAAPAASSMPAASAGTTEGNTNRTCTADTTAGTVKVVITFTSGTATSNKAGRLASATKVSSSVSGTGTLTREWTLPTGKEADAACTNKNHIKFPGGAKSSSGMVGLSLKETEARSRTMNVTKAGKTLTGRTMATSGTRSISFTAPDDTTLYTYKKTISTDVTRSIKLTKPDGTSIDRTKKMSNPTPLEVNVKRNATTGELESKTISKGEIKAEMSAENIVVSTTFNNVKYDFSSSNDNTCTPVSGTISGSTSKAGTVQKSYTIDFGADATTYPSGISIKVGDAAAIDCPTCVVAQCDMN